MSIEIVPVKAPYTRASTGISWLHLGREHVQVSDVLAAEIERLQRAERALAIAETALARIGTVARRYRDAESAANGAMDLAGEALTAIAAAKETP